MTDAMGHFVGGGRMHLSPREIQKMKKNMRKVPVIQERSELYHEAENKEAERFINEQLHMSESGSGIAGRGMGSVNEQHTIGLRGKIKNRIHNKIKTLYTLKQK